MLISNDIVYHFREFIQKCNSLSDGQRMLKTLRNTLIANYSLQDSRCIWMSLLLYKNKQDMETSDQLWSLSRIIIIAILSGNPNIENPIQEYLQMFAIWKENNLIDLITEIGGCYYNILQIKQSLTESPDETKNVWMPQYESILTKIREHCQMIGIFDKVEQFIKSLEESKYNIISEIMQRAYWDKIQQDIENKDYDIIFRNLQEIKTLLLDIIPGGHHKSYIEDAIDIELIRNAVMHDAFDKDYLLTIYAFIISVLRDWDTIAFIPKYDKEIDELDKLDGTMPFLIRTVLQKSITLTIDLKSRKDIWNLILRHK
ncbi:MAG: hypothetical protein Gaeavirus34_5 [Gaeavirus sp.]|uniref:Uncharacterized protein n=1 Tax=Gaeavirus sp. TaxID=2487767 RepID=A0A3G4ZZQ2_9VIRU|nr:MAG: hypothetical protein Gaeavirus34_5 [Gaeavirus sp.]